MLRSAFCWKLGFGALTPGALWRLARSINPSEHAGLDMRFHASGIMKVPQTRICTTAPFPRLNFQIRH